MASSIVVYPRISPRREIKFTLESFRDEKSSAEGLQRDDAGIIYIPSNTFKYRDQLPDTSPMLGAVPATGTASDPAIEIIKGLDTSNDYIVPQLVPDVKFSYASSHKAVYEYKEVKVLGVNTVPALVGPVSYLMLSKPAMGVDKTFSLLCHLGKILPIYKQVVSELKAARASMIQSEEPTLVMDLDSHKLQAFTEAYAQLESSLSGLNVLIETYFADIPAEANKILSSLKGFTGFGFDLVRGTKTLGLIKGAFPKSKYLFAEVVDGRNICANDLAASLKWLMADAGIEYIPSNTYAYYDQVLDTTPMLGAIPPRSGWNGCEIGFDVYFSMARGNASVPAMEMTKWFDTNHHYIVPELGSDIKLSHASHKAVNEYKEAKALGVNTVAVLVGPLSYMLLSKPAKGVDKTFSLLSLLGKILPFYKEVVSKLKVAGASWIQFDEPSLVMDLDSHKLQAFTEAYTQLESSLSGLNVLIGTYFADIPAEAYKVLTSLKGVTGFGFDLVLGTKALDLIKGAFPQGKDPFAGVVDGRNIWANDLGASLSTLNALAGIVSKDKLGVSTSCFLLQTAFDLVNETKLDKEINSWLAFAAQKVVAGNLLAKALAGQKDEVPAGLHIMSQDLTDALSLPFLANFALSNFFPIHTCMLYSHFKDLIHSIINMDSDIITTENSHSDEKLLLLFHEGVKYDARIGPSINDIHSPTMPSTEEMADRINEMLAVLDKNILWLNPDYGLKTGKYTEVKAALKSMIAATEVFSTQLGSAN